MIPTNFAQKYEIDLEWAVLAFWGLVVMVEFRWKKNAPLFLRAICWFPGKFLRVTLIIMTLGALAGCGNPDPLAVASGPLYPLNAGHWQATPQDLSAPPPVANN